MSGKDANPKGARDIKVFNDQCLPLYFSGATKYFLVTDNSNTETTTWNQADDPYKNGHSSDFYFTEVVSFDPTKVFEYSDAPQDGEFAENTYWYYLTLRNKYATFSESDNHVNLTSTSSLDKGSLWAFVKTADGTIEIYNALTGANKVLASDKPQTNDNGTGGDETEPTMVDKNDLGEKCGTWTINPGENLFYLKRSADTEEYYLNERTGILAFWSNSASASNEGSQFRVETFNLEKAIEEVRTNQEAVNGAVGTLTSSSYEAFKNALSKNTLEGLFEALTIRDKTGEKVQLDINKYYRIKSTSNEKYIGLRNTGFLLNEDNSSTNANLIIKFEPVSGKENTYYLKMQNEYVGDIKKASYEIGFEGKVLTISDTETYTFKKGEYQLEYNNGIGKIALKNVNTDVQTYTYIHQGGTGIVAWDNIPAASWWYIIEAPSIEKEITAAEYATIKYPFAVQLQDEVTAYTATVAGDKAKLSPVDGNIVPANSPVILKGAAKTYTLTITKNNDEALTSDLEGTLLPQTIDATTAYVLAKPEAKEVGFYLLESGEGANRTIGANKAYLTVTNPAGIKAFTFDFGGTTGIENTEAVTEETEEYYDLQGRRVMNPTKGIYVTKSGKKVLFTK